MLAAEIAGALGSTADPFAMRALAALERQAQALTILQARLEAAVVVAPVVANCDWRSPAQRVYDLGLAEFRATLALGCGAVDDALAETRRAMSNLSARVG